MDFAASSVSLEGWRHALDAQSSTKRVHIRRFRKPTSLSHEDLWVELLA